MTVDPVQEAEDKEVSESVEELEEILRREMPKYAGVYIAGSVQDVEANITVDTGATSTLLSTAIYNQIPDDRRPKLAKIGRRAPKTANGELIKCDGYGTFELSLGPLTLNKSMTVADIEDDVLLGADILLQDEHGPADLMLSEGHVKLRGKCIPVERVGVIHTSRRMYAADRYAIPVECDIVHDEHMDCPGDDVAVTDEYIHCPGDDVAVIDEYVHCPGDNEPITDVHCPRSDEVAVKARMVDLCDKPMSVKPNADKGYATEVIQPMPDEKQRTVEGYETEPCGKQEDMKSDEVVQTVSFHTENPSAAEGMMLQNTGTDDTVKSKMNECVLWLLMLLCPMIMPQADPYLQRSDKQKSVSMMCNDHPPRQEKPVRVKNQQTTVHRAVCHILTPFLKLGRGSKGARIQASSDRRTHEEADGDARPIPEWSATKTVPISCQYLNDGNVQGNPRMTRIMKNEVNFRKPYADEMESSSDVQ